MIFPKLTHDDEQKLCLQALDLRAKGAKNFSSRVARMFMAQNNMDPDALTVRYLAQRIRRCMDNLDKFVSTRKYCNRTLTPEGNEWILTRGGKMVQICTKSIYSQFRANF